MALAYKNSTRQIVIRMNDGKDKDGKDTFKNLTYDNVAPDVTDDKIMQFFEGIKTLSSAAFVGVKLIEPKTIIEQA